MNRYTVFACKDGKGEYREYETETEYKHDDIIKLDSGEWLFVTKEYPECEFIVWGIMEMLRGNLSNHPPIYGIGFDEDTHELTFRVKNGEYYSYTITRNEV